MWRLFPLVSSPPVMTTQNPRIQAQTIGILSGREVIGDGLIKLPFLRALRAAWPAAQIHWITTQGPTVYNGSLRETTTKLIDFVHETPDLKNPPEFWPERFDLLIDTRGRWKQALQARLRYRYGCFIAPAFRYLFSALRPPLFAPRPPSLNERLLQLVELAAGYAPPVTGRLPVAPALMAKARQILPEGPVYIGFAPGAGNAIKKWPVERFEKAAKEQARLGRTPVFLLGPQEMDIYDRLFRSVPEAIFPLQAHAVWGTREPAVEYTLALGHCLDLAVVNDSGTSHMLAAVDCPLISLFGPTSAAKLAPKVTHGHVLAAQDFGGVDMAAIPLESATNTINQMVISLGRA